MKAIALRSPVGLDRREVEDRPDPGQPGSGGIRTALARGADIVGAVGTDVAGRTPGHPVVSCFVPDWQERR